MMLGGCIFFSHSSICKKICIKLNRKIFLFFVFLFVNFVVFAILINSIRYVYHNYLKLSDTLKDD